MKVFITGSNGLLGQKLLDKLSGDKSVDIIAASKGPNRVTLNKDCKYISLDITEESELRNILLEENPEIMINTPAMTNVDLCEDNKALCDDINVNAVEYLADICLSINAHLIHISTDFIFDGEKGMYSEDDKPNPLSYYGLSKYKSEKILYNHSCRWTIIRTIVVFGVAENLKKRNIVLWAKDVLEKGEELNIIDDQFRAPTLAEDLADACILAAKKNKCGIFNASGKDVMSIYEIVERVAKYYGYPTDKINKVSTKTLNQKASRPPKTAFVLDKSREVLGYDPHSFEECLDIITQQLNT